MYYGIYWYQWYILYLVCITCIGEYWYVFRGHICKYSYVLVSIGMYEKMVCIVHIGMYCTYWYILILYIDLYWMYWYVLVCMVCTGLYLLVLVSNDMYYTYW